MTTTRKQYSPKLKARVAIEAILGEKTLNQLGSHFGVHPVQSQVLADGKLTIDNGKFVGCADRGGS